MFERYTETARRVIFFARYEASQFGTSEIVPEQLLLGILREAKALTRQLLGDSSVVEAIRKRIEAETPRGEKPALSVDLPMSLASKRILAYAAEESGRLNHKHIGAEHMLAGILREEKTLAAKILTEHGITVERLQEEAHLRAEAAPTPVPSAPGPITRPPTVRPFPPPPPPSSKSELVTRDLTYLARTGQLTPLIGRDRELERIIQVLSRRTRRNPVLIGEPGAGKGAIVEGLAQRIASGAVPPGLLDRKLLSIDVAGLLPPRRGQELPSSDSAAILFIEGLFDIGAAGYSWSVLEAMRILEPMLARGGLQVVATGTPAGYRELMEKAAPLALHFEAVPVLPPTDKEAAAILRGIKGQYEQFHDVTFSDEAIEAAIAASARFLRHRVLPDRALDLLDEAAAYVSLQRGAGGSPEEREIRKRMRIAAHKMEVAIFEHLFDRAKEFAKQEQAEKQKLRELLAAQEQEENAAPSGVVTERDIIHIVAGRVGAPVAVVESVMQQPDAGEIERIAKSLIALVPQGREWLEPLSAYLAGCVPEDVEKFAETIRAAKR